MYTRIIVLAGIILFDLSQGRTQVLQSPSASESFQSKTPLVPHLLGTGEKFNGTGDFEDVPNTEFSIPTSERPTMRTQDGTNLCQTFCATTLVEREYCRQEGFENCQSIPDTQKISPISMLMYRKDAGDDELRALGSFTESDGKQTYELLDKISSLASAPVFFSESCLPFDKFVEKDKFKEDYTALKSFFTKLEDTYNAAKKNPKSTEAATINNCEECSALLNEIITNFNIELKMDILHKALGAKNFNVFLYKTLLENNRKINPSSCKQFALKKPIAFEHFPKFDPKPNAPHTSFSETIKVIEEKIRQGKPVSVSSVCIAQTSDQEKKCLNHCVVITGIKKVRHKITKKEIEVVQLNNSWGKNWNGKSTDGWIRASSLYDVMLTDDDRTISKEYPKRSKMFANTLSWVK